MSGVRCQEIVLHLQYALAKQVPAMSSGCTIHTNYGDIRLEPDDAQKVSALVARLLEKKLAKATKVRP